MSLMILIKWFLTMTIPFFIFSSIMYLFQDDTEHFATRLILALVMAIIFRLMEVDKYKYKSQ